MFRVFKRARRTILFAGILSLCVGSLELSHAGTTVVWSGSVSLPNGYTINAGDVVEFNPSVSTTVTSSKNIVVKGTLRMKPANDGVVHLLKFAVPNESAFVGGGDVVFASDTGLWVSDAGRLDILGAPKLAWARATTSLAAGATTVTLDAPVTGWKVGDEILIAPTDNPKVSGFSTHQELRTVTWINGASVGFSALSYAHPRVTVKAGVAYGAEVSNLTRNVRIEGQDATHRAHVWMKSSVPQSIRYASIRYMGPQQAGSVVAGRYGLHFHRMGEGSRGSLVEGVVVRQTGSYGFVPHASNGVTFRNTIAFDTQRSAYWYDPGPTEAPNDTLYDHALAGYVRTPSGMQGMRNMAFNLASGDGNVCWFCVAFSVQGGKNASGFGWPEGESGQWNFQNAVAHNNARDGIFVWQNGAELHTISGFVAYYNGAAGIEHGAYTNRYMYEDVTLYANLSAGVILHAESKEGPPPTTFARAYIDGAGITKYAYLLEAPVNVDQPTTLVCQNTIVGLAPGGASYKIDYTGPDATIAERLKIASVC